MNKKIKNMLLVIAMFLPFAIIASNELDELFKQLLPLRGKEYVQVRDKILSFDSGVIKKHIGNMMNDTTVDDYIKLHLSIIKERIEKKDVIDRFENSHWLEDDKMKKILDRYRKLSKVRDILGTKYPSPRMREEMLKQHFINYAEKYGLKYIFLEGMLKRLPYQGIDYFPIPVTVNRGSMKLSFQSDLLSIPQDSAYYKSNVLFPLRFDYYMVGLLKTGNERLIIPVVVNDVKENKKYADVEYLAYFKERKYLPLLFNYFLKNSKLFPEWMLFYMASKDDIAIINDYKNQINWSAACDDFIKSSYDPIYLNSLSEKEYKELRKKSYPEEVAKLGFELAFEEFANGNNSFDDCGESFKTGLEDLYPDFSFLDANLKRFKQEEADRKSLVEEWQKIENIIPGISEYTIDSPLRKEAGFLSLDLRNPADLNAMLKQIDKAQTRWKGKPFEEKIIQVRNELQKDGIDAIAFKVVKDKLSEQIADFEKLFEGYLNTLEYEGELKAAKDDEEIKRVKSWLDRTDDYPLYYSMDQKILANCLKVMDENINIWQDKEYFVGMYNTIKKVLSKSRKSDRKPNSPKE